MKRKFPAFLVITLLLIVSACKKDDIKETTLTKEFNGLAYVVPDSINTQYSVAVPVAKNDWLGIFADKGIEYDYNAISNMGFGDLFIRNVDGSGSARNFDNFSSADLFLRYEDGTEEQAATVARIEKGTTQLEFTGLDKNLKAFLDKPKFYAVIKMNKSARDGQADNLTADLKVNIIVAEKQ
jgi:hypothetical protein